MTSSHTIFTSKTQSHESRSNSSIKSGINVTTDMVSKHLEDKIKQSKGLSKSAWKSKVPAPLVWSGNPPAPLVWKVTYDGDTTYDNIDLDSLRFVGDRYQVILKLHNYVIKHSTEHKDLFEAVEELGYRVGGEDRMFHDYYETLDEAVEDFIKMYFFEQCPFQITPSNTVIYV